MEVGRWAIPPVPPDERFCKYCDDNTPDTEIHFLLKCKTFSFKRQCFFGKMASLGIIFRETATDSEILSTILCPTNSQTAKCVNKYIKILFNNRELLDNGVNIDQLGHVIHRPQLKSVDDWLDDTSSISLWSNFPSDDSTDCDSVFDDL